MKGSVRLGLLASILLSMACSARTVPSPSDSAASVVPSPSPSAATILPSPSSLTSAPPASTAPGVPSSTNLQVEWLRVPTSPNLAGAAILAVVPVSSGLVALGCANGGDSCTQPAVWFSRDGRGWAPPTLLPIAEDVDSGSGHAVAEGPRGMVIGGSVRREGGLDSEGETRAAMWFSSDGGASFEPVADDESFAMAHVSAVRPVGAGFSAVGPGTFSELAGFKAWWSDDGLTWRDATPPAGNEAFGLHLLPAPDGGLVAWGPSCGTCLPVTAWWSTPDGSSWTAEGTAAGPEGALLEDAIITSGGLLGVGRAFGGDGQSLPGMWEGSADGSQWFAIERPGVPPEASLDLLLPVGNGVVAAGTSPGTPVSSALVIGRAPGTDRWHELAAITGLTPLAILRQPTDPRGLVLVGRAGAEGRGEMVTWLGGVDWAP